MAKRQTQNLISIPAHSANYTVENLIPFSSYCFSLQASYAQEGIVFSNKQSVDICDINTPPLGEFLPHFSCRVKAIMIVGLWNMNLLSAMTLGY